MSDFLGGLGDVDYTSDEPEIFRDALGRSTPFKEFRENPSTIARYNTTFDSYSGTDIAATILLPGEEKPLHLGDIHTLSYSTHRENTPVRYLGHSNPCGWVKGPRTIAGSMVFTQFNNYTWYRLDRFRAQINKGMYPLADMLPPFDIVLTFANESGSFSKMKVLGVTIVDEGAAMSVDDLMIECDYTFMAQALQPITSYIPEGFGVLKNWTAAGPDKVVRIESTAGDRLGIGFR